MPRGPYQEEEQQETNKRGLLGHGRALLKQKKSRREEDQKKQRQQQQQQRVKPVEAAHAAAAKLHKQHEHDERIRQHEMTELDLLYDRPPSPPPPPPGHFQIDPVTRRKQHEFQTYFSVTAIGAKSKDFAYAAANTMAALGVHGEGGGDARCPSYTAVYAQSCVLCVFDKCRLTSLDPHPY